MVNVRNQAWTLIPAIAGLVIVAGCGSDLPLTVPVEGRLTYDGGEMPGPGYISFTPVEVAEGYPRRPGRSLFNQDGQFAVTSWNDGDGLVPGTYFLRIDCWQNEPTMNRPVGKSHIPSRYNDRELSPIKEIVVEPSSGSIDLGVINIEPT